VEGETEVLVEDGRVTSSFLGKKPPPEAARHAELRGSGERYEETAMIRRCSAALVGVAVLAVLATMAPGADLEAGKALYAKWCQGCHGPDGRGNPAMEKMLKTKVNDFTAIDLSKLSQADREAKEAEYRKVVAEGKKPMAPFAKKLSKEEQDAVLQYVETTFMKAAP
jgi:mono/diheme cytochrome c family protein